MRKNEARSEATVGRTVLSDAVEKATGSGACLACQLVPISHLAFDVSVPMAGWVSFFDARGVEIVRDDVGRLAVDRSVVAALIAEQDAAAAARAVEERRRRDEAKAKPRPRTHGIPAPEGNVSAVAAMIGHDRDGGAAWPYGRGEFTGGRK